MKKCFNGFFIVSIADSSKNLLSTSETPTLKFHRKLCLSGDSAFPRPYVLFVLQFVPSLVIARKKCIRIADRLREMIMSSYSCIMVLAERKNLGGKPDGEIQSDGASFSRVGARVYATRECVSYGLSFSSGLRVSALK